MDIDQRIQLLERLDRSLALVRASLGLRHDELYRIGIGHGGLHVLQLLASRGSLKASGIASLLGVSSASVTGIANNLVRDGLIRRQPDAHDRRVVRVEITPLGLDKLKEAENLRAERKRLVVADISDSELRLLAAVADRIVEALKRDAQTPVPARTSVEGSSI